MRAFNKSGGMYSCKLAMYVYALSLQMAIGYFLLLCSPNKLDLHSVVKVRGIDDIKNVGFDVLQGAGVAHIVLAVATFCFLILSHFVTVCFKLPMLLISIVQAMYCSGTAGVCILYLQKGYASITEVINLVKSSGLTKNTPVPDSFFVDNRNYLFTIGLLCVFAASLFHQAQLVQGEDNITHAMVVVPCITLGLGIAYCLTTPCRDYRTFTLGFFWMVICSAGDILTSTTRWCCMKPLKLLLLGIYAAILLMCVITIGVCTTLYTGGKIDYSSYLDIVHGKVKQFSAERGQTKNYNLVTQYFENVTTSYSSEQLNVYMGNGNFLVVAVLLSIICMVFCILSLIYSVFRIFDVKRNSTVSQGEVRVVVA